MRSRVRVQLCASVGIVALGLLPILGTVHALVERHTYCSEHAAFEDVDAAAPVLASTPGTPAVRAAADGPAADATHTQCTHTAYRACAPAAERDDVVADDFPTPAYEAPRPRTLSPLALLAVAPKSSPPFSA
jgi:hypothetical protein